MVLRLPILILTSCLLALTSGCDSDDANKGAKAKTPAAAKKAPDAKKAPGRDQGEAKAADPAPDEAGDKADGGKADPGKPSDGPPPGVKVKGNVITRTSAELAAEDAARTACVTKCVDARKVEARGADDIKASCTAECMKTNPIVQVEVVDGPIAAPR